MRSISSAPTQPASATSSRSASCASTTSPKLSGAWRPGGSVIDPEVVARLLGRAREHSPLDELTPREREILGLMAEGRSNAGIALSLTVDAKTVEGHVSQIFGKLGLERETQDNRRVLAVVEYLRTT